MLGKSSLEDLFWVYPKENTELRDKIIKEYRIHPVIAQVLCARGFEDLDEIHRYFYAKLPDLLDPFLLTDMMKAVDRVIEAFDKKENVLIYGDNDVDGITGASLLVDFLRYIGINVFYYIAKPSIQRKDLVLEALPFALEKACKLLITVDCGVTSALEIEQVIKNDIDVIVTDHHEPTDRIPSCIATLNPKLVGNAYPNKELTGVGVAFKLAHAVTNRLIEDGKIHHKRVDLKKYLDLVALGTIADMGSLLGENRILVRYGIKQFKKTRRIGLVKLLSLTDIDVSHITSFIIAVKVAPRINSLGRIADPNKGVEMLLVRNVASAEKLAIELDLNNLERQRIEKIMSMDIESFFTTGSPMLKHKAIVLESEKWHPGIIPILSSRIARQYNRPTVLIAIEDGIGKGSLRSIPEFPLLSILKDLSDLFINFGGHDYAAGITIPQKNIPEFKKRFFQIADKELSDNDVMNKLLLDAQMDFRDISFDFMESIRLLEPFGNENSPPVFYTKAKQAWPPKVVGKTNLKLYLEQDDRMLEGIAFGKADLSPKLRKRNIELEVAFTPHINYYQGPSIQLIIRDFKILEAKEK